MADKQRADVALVMRGLSESREKAQAVIMAGLVYIDEKKVLKASEMIKTDDNLLVRGQLHPYVSRGGLKLEKAINAFNADVAGIVAMDIGAATGGFTDVLLQNGARHVYAIDVGYGQLDWKLRNDERVTVMERTNARLLTEDSFAVRPLLTVMDVSFISIKLILPVAAQIMGAEGRFYTLIKPQFEAGKENVGKKGVVRDKIVHRNVLNDVVSFVDGMSWRVTKLDYSPIKGPEGNIEFLACIEKNGQTVETEQIDQIVDDAHSSLVQE